VHDAGSGSAWSLDADHGNSIVTWQDVRLIVEVKSLLGVQELESARRTMERLEDFAKANSQEIPLRILFAYKVDPDVLEDLMEKFASYSSSIYPFDAFILLEEGAYFTDELRSLRLGIPKGLGPAEVENDGPSVDRMIMEDCVPSKYPHGFRWVPDGTPENNLLSLAALASYATVGNETTGEFLAAIVPRDYNPIFQDVATGAPVAEE
jgi:hypothetical protein